MHGNREKLLDRQMQTQAEVNRHAREQRKALRQTDADTRRGEQTCRGAEKGSQTDGRRHGQR